MPSSSLISVNKYGRVLVLLSKLGITHDNRINQEVLLKRKLSWLRTSFKPVTDTLPEAGTSAPLRIFIGDLPQPFAPLQPAVAITKRS